MKRCSFFFIVLVLAAASVGVLAASDEQPKTDENKVQPLSSSSSSADKKRQPIDSTEESLPPHRKAGAAHRSKRIRLKMHKQRRGARGAAKGIEKDSSEVPSIKVDALEKETNQRQEAAAEQKKSEVSHDPAEAPKDKEKDKEKEKEAVISQTSRAAEAKAPVDTADKSRDSTDKGSKKEEGAQEDGSKKTEQATGKAIKDKQEADTGLELFSSKAAATEKRADTIQPAKKAVKAPSNPEAAGDKGSPPKAKDEAKAAAKPEKPEELAKAAAPSSDAAEKASSEAGKDSTGSKPKDENTLKPPTDKRESAEPLPHDSNPQDAVKDQGDPAAKNKPFEPLNAPGEGASDPGYDSSQSKILFTAGSAPKKGPAPEGAKQLPGKAAEGDAPSAAKKAEKPASFSAALKDLQHSGDGDRQEPSKVDRKEEAVREGKETGPSEEGGKQKGGERKVEEKGERAEKSGSGGQGEAAAQRADKDAKLTRSGSQENDSLRQALDLLQDSAEGDGIWVLSPKKGTLNPVERPSDAEEEEDDDFQYDDEADVSSTARIGTGSGKAAVIRKGPGNKAGAASKAEQADQEEEGTLGLDPEMEPKEAAPDQDAYGMPEMVDVVSHTAFSRLLDTLKVSSFLDVPCGDAEQVASKVTAFPTTHPDSIRYIGVDDSSEAIKSADAQHGDTPKWSFVEVQDYVHADLPRADLLVSRAALLRPPLLRLVDMLANFARSGAKHVLLGSFSNPDLAENAYSAFTADGKDGASTEGATFFLSLQHEPFALKQPLRVFPAPEGFRGDYGEAAKSGNGARFGDAPARQMLLYSGDYLRQQSFDEMRKRVEKFLLPDKDEE